MDPYQNLPANTSEDLFAEVEQMRTKVDAAKLPDELKEKINEMLARLKRMAKYGGYSEEYDKISHYVAWVVSLPWYFQTEDNLDINRAAEILDKHHYGMQKVKNRILEYMSVLKLNRDKNKVARAPIMCLVGLVGTGKTTFGTALAEAMGRAYCRIPFGGMGSALDLRGQSRLHIDTEPGKVIKALRQAKNRNPVMLLDEIDRVGENARADIMGVLVELLDPEQNARFIDHYIDYPFDLSDTLFLATCNNTRHIATAVLDRMEVIEMPSYTDEEKITIAKNYILPKVLMEAGLDHGQISLADNTWANIVRPLGFDSGIRSLERTIRGVVYRIARMVVAGKGEQYSLDESNIKSFLPDY